MSHSSDCSLHNGPAEIPTPCDCGAEPGLTPEKYGSEFPRPVTLVDGSPVTPDHAELKENGQQKAYVVLSAEERAKGFIRPVRQTYRHVGDAPPSNLRDLTAEEQENYGDEGYVKFEEYPPEKSPVTGKFWTQAQLDEISKACEQTTTMALPLAETYARQPNFYGGTFCCGCNTHFPVSQFVWAGTTERVGS